MRKVSLLLLMFCVGVAPASPQGKTDAVPLGNWAKVESLPQRSWISVQLKSGDTMQGEFLGLDFDAIHLRMEDKERTYPKRSIIEIRLLGVKDSNKNGTLIGLGIGAGVAGIMAAAKYDKNDPYRNLAWAGIPLFAGIGALVGYGIDKSHKGTDVIYRTLVTR